MSSRHVQHHFSKPDLLPFESYPLSELLSQCARLRALIKECNDAMMTVQDEEQQSTTAESVIAAASETAFSERVATVSPVLAHSTLNIQSLSRSLLSDSTTLLDSSSALSPPPALSSSHGSAVLVKGGEVTAAVGSPVVEPPSQLLMLLTESSVDTHPANKGDETLFQSHQLSLTSSTSAAGTSTTCSDSLLPLSSSSSSAETAPAIAAAVAQYPSAMGLLVASAKCEEKIEQQEHSSLVAADIEFHNDNNEDDQQQEGSKFHKLKKSLSRFFRVKGENGDEQTTQVVDDEGFVPL